jgi:protein required for attachment to host cells
MSQFLVAVIDGAKTRFLTLEPAELLEYGVGSFNLVEQESLVNPDKKLKGPDELWSITKNACYRSSSDQVHNDDDPRQRLFAESERRFAQLIADRVIHLAQIHQVQQIILAAEPKILGLMREVLIPVLPQHLKTSELSKNLCYFKPHKLHQYLANKGLLPAFKRASSVA